MPGEVSSEARSYPPRPPRAPTEPAIQAGFTWGWRILVPPSRAASHRFKRFLDIVLAGALLFALLPVLVVAGVGIAVTSGRPIVFVQQRIGHRCRTFRMYKLRTMRPGADSQQAALAGRRSAGIFFKLRDDPRTTRLGRWLRKYSVDEIPQLFNVLKGDMSLVGPRPLLLTDFAKLPKSEQLRRFSVKPGLTGLWQVSGRSRLDDSDRIALDLAYVDRWSPWFDLKILVRTIPAVLRGEGSW